MNLEPGKTARRRGPLIPNPNAKLWDQFHEVCRFNLKTAVRIDREPRELRENQSWNGSLLALGSFLIGVAPWFWQCLVCSCVSCVSRFQLLFLGSNTSAERRRFRIGCGWRVSPNFIGIAPNSLRPDASTSPGSAGSILKRQFGLTANHANHAKTKAGTAHFSHCEASALEWRHGFWQCLVCSCVSCVSRFQLLFLGSNTSAGRWE